MEYSSFNGSIAPRFFNTPTFNNVNFISTNDFSFIVRNSTGNREITIEGDLTISSDSKIELTSNSVASGGGKIFLEGDLDNSGTITSSGVAGTINDFELNGSAHSNIPVQEQFQAVNFIMDNTAGATLNTPLTLPYKLTLTNGKINTTTAELLTLIDNATSSAGSQASFVNGPMKKIGDDDFIFPVGTSTGVGGIYAPIGISGTGGAQF